MLNQQFLQHVKSTIWIQTNYFFIMLNKLFLSAYAQRKTKFPR